MPLLILSRLSISPNTHTNNDISINTEISIRISTNINFDSKTSFATRIIFSICKGTNSSVKILVSY